VSSGTASPAVIRELAQRAAGIVFVSFERREVSDMQCSICGAEAENLSSGDFDGLIVRCKRCGDYALASAALNEFLRLDYDARVAALEKARQIANGANRAVIDRNDF
jgi:transposase